MDSTQINYVKDLVFEGTIGHKAAQILTHLILNSSEDEFFQVNSNKGTPQVCELPVEDLCKKFKMPVPNMRHHLRSLEKKGLIKQMYLFQGETGGWIHVDSYKAVLRIGVRAMKGQYYIIKVPKGVM